MYHKSLVPFFKLPFLRASKERDRRLIYNLVGTGSCLFAAGSFNLEPAAGGSKNRGKSVIRVWAAFIQRLSSSTFLLTACLLLIVDAALAQIKPLRLFNNTGLTTINQNFLVSKLPEILSSSENPEVLLLGSSLVLFPAVRCDDQLHGVKTRFDRWYVRNHISEYARADALQHLLAGSGHPVSVRNLAIASSVVSDQYLILKKYLSTGKKPHLVVLCLAPRDFLDNQRARVEKTPTYCAIADFTSVSDLIESKASFDTIAEHLIGSSWQYYREKSDYHNLFSCAAGLLSKHPINLYDASQHVLRPAMVSAATGSRKQPPQQEQAFVDSGVLDQQKPLWEPPSNTCNDLDNYKKMYWPVNLPLLSLQAEYLKKFCGILQAENIPLLLVTMPLTKENLALLPDSALKKYDSNIRTLATEYGATLIQPSKSGSFELSDFEDSCHMNAAGGNKLFKLIAETICCDRQLAKSLANKQQLAAGGRQSRN